MSGVDPDLQVFYYLRWGGAEVEAIDIYDVNEEIQNIFKIKGKSSQRELWDNIESHSPNLNFRYYDGINIPFDNENFDYVFLHAVVEHIPGKILDKVISDIDRVLKPGGLIVVSRTPNAYSLSEFLAHGHDVLYTKKELIGKFNGFSKVIYYTKTDFLPEIFPENLQKIANFLLPVYVASEKIIPFTPLKIFAHHHFVIFKKC